MTLSQQRLRQRLRRFPRIELSHTPTPLALMPRLSQAVGDVELWVKRDDCTGLAMGGNKARQLEFYFGEAVERGCDTVLSTGAVQSNYLCMIAAAAARLGMQCHIQVEDRVDNAGVDYRCSGNVLLDNLFGAQVHTCANDADEAGADAALQALADALRAQGRRPYIIPLGGGHKPLGALGYVDAAVELLQQMRRIQLAPDVLVVGSGSGLTHTGLLTGLRMAGSAISVIGACVRRDAPQQQARVVQRCERLQAMLDLPGVVQPQDVQVDDRAFAPGYGKQSDKVLRAIKLAAVYEGLLFDPVYSGKTLACTLDLIESGDLAGGSKVVLLHTGGLPALFAYRQQMQAVAAL